MINLAYFASHAKTVLPKASLKTSPVIIASESAAKFNSPNYEVTAVNGYINFKLI